MANLTTKVLGNDGTKPTFVAADAAGDKINNPGPGLFAVVKVGATSTTITAVVPGTLSTGDAFPDKVYGPLVSDEVWIPIPRNYAGSDGKATLNYNQVAGVTVAAVICQ